MAAAGFWDNQERAQETVGELKSLKSIVDPLATNLSAIDDLDALIEMAEEEPAMEDELLGELALLEKATQGLELKSLLSGEYDGCGAILNLNARDGGTDANDWAEMLMRMYIQWAQKNEYNVTLLDRNDNAEAGINSASIAIRGPMAYGYLKGEHGIHRLVRISPFNSEGKRQTSFASVDVSPEIAESVDVEIDELKLPGQEDRVHADPEALGQLHRIAALGDRHHLRHRRPPRWGCYPSRGLQVGRPQRRAAP